MAEVLLDTNIVLDYVNPQRPEHASAAMLLEGIWETDNYTPVMSVSSLKDTYYVLNRKYKPEPLVRERLYGLAQSIHPKELTLDIIDMAFKSDEPDFEDGIIRATAESIGAAAIITRDKAAFKNSSVPSMTAQEFCYQMS